MTVESVKKQIERDKLDLKVLEMEESTATVELAANALGVEPARIAKTMAIRLKERDVLIVAKGDVKIDNRKFKDQFHEKPKFIGAEDLMEATGHPVGGVCPFGLKKDLDIYLDESIKIFDHVYPAAGEPNTCLKIDVDYLQDVTKGEWIDVCKE
ncbi:YbaK/EbsC family protein [Tissierella creatinini]|nr:YbaK/EbsC family protein [Tissierella creatinini]TJX66527.1 YbaK/EbsC family protein [Soehngenia saccharolytica]